MDALTKAATAAFRAKLVPFFDVQQAILFGSRARKTHQVESDADVAVVLRGKAGHFLETKFAMDDLAYEVLLDTGIRIQPLPIWMDEWEHPDHYSNPRLLINIKSEGLVL
jgi:predicted nucleotidyltransferase